jgi:hypothetical protein
VGAPLDAGVPSGSGVAGRVKSPSTGVPDSAVSWSTFDRNWARVKIPLVVKQ